MAKTYFYKKEWLPAQIKCSECRFKSEGDYSPDAHLLMSFHYFYKRNIMRSKTMLSRTVDVS